MKKYLTIILITLLLFTPSIINASFDVSSIKSVRLNLLESQVDLILNALMFYQYNLEYVAGIFSDSEEERLNELAKVKYTYEHLRSSKADQIL